MNALLCCLASEDYGSPSSSALTCTSLELCIPEDHSCSHVLLTTSFLSKCAFKCATCSLWFFFAVTLLNLTNTVIILIPLLLSICPCFLSKLGLFHELYIKISMTAWTVPRALCYSAIPIHPHLFCSLIFYVVLRTSSQEEDTIIITFFQFICAIVTAEIISESHIAAKWLFQNVSNGRP